MEEIGGWKDGTGGQPEVIGQALVLGIVQELGMFDGIVAVLVDVRVQRREIVVAQSSMVARVHVQVDGIGPSTEKGVSWI